LRGAATKQSSQEEAARDSRACFASTVANDAGPAKKACRHLRRQAFFSAQVFCGIYATQRLPNVGKRETARTARAQMTSELTWPTHRGRSGPVLRRAAAVGRVSKHPPLRRDTRTIN
jgi:hypothetical protein